MLKRSLGTHVRACQSEGPAKVKSALARIGEASEKTGKKPLGSLEAGGSLLLTPAHVNQIIFAARRNA